MEKLRRVAVAKLDSDLRIYTSDDGEVRIRYTPSANEKLGSLTVSEHAIEFSIVKKDLP